MIPSVAFVAGNASYSSCVITCGYIEASNLEFKAVTKSVWSSISHSISHQVVVPQPQPQLPAIFFHQSAVY
jgi:hypothetical protein